MSKNQRNVCLDLMKVVAACAVVCIHIKFPGWFGQAVDAVARFAVPLFFMVSGYFACFDGTDKIKKKLFHILKIYAVSVVLYFVYGFVRALFYDVQFAMTRYLGKYTDVTFWFSWLFLNNSQTPGHLWFLPALAYTYGMQILLLKCRWKKEYYMLLGIGLLCVHLILGELLPASGVEIPHIWIRNFLLMGYPCFALGMILRKYQNTFLHQMTPMTCMGIVFLGVIESCISGRLFGWCEMYVGSILIAVAVMVLCLQYRGKNYGKVLTLVSGTSLYVYILHIMIDEILSLFLQKVGFPYTADTWRWLQPIAVCIVSVGVGVLIQLFLNHWKWQYKVKGEHK